jgi:hypothetical protein
VSSSELSRSLVVDPIQGVDWIGDVNNAFAEAVASSNIAVLDLASHYRELSERVQQAVSRVPVSGWQWPSRC